MQDKYLAHLYLNPKPNAVFPGFHFYTPRNQTQYARLNVFIQRKLNEVLIIDGLLSREGLNADIDMF
jgi:hypothetical protein